MLVGPQFGLAAPPQPRGGAASKQVELFEAMRDGQVAVKLIPKNVKEAKVLIENKADVPLQIKLPEAFAGVPVLAQIGGLGGVGGGGGRQRGGGGGGMNQGMNQGMGGGMGGMGMGGMGMGGMGMGGMGMGGGMFNVDPGKVGKIDVPTVCLEHGKTDPNPRVAYELRPIESFTTNQKVIEVCKMLGRGEVTQRTAQAAAWHLTDGLSWAELAEKDRVRLSNGYTEKYFGPEDIAMAMRVVGEAARRAAENPPKSPGEVVTASTGQK
jgi:hypothetical protein